VARLPAGQGLALGVAVGPLQPAVLAVPEPLFVPELPARLPRLEPLFVPESQPAPPLAPEPVQVALEEAPAAEVPALLALVLAEPLALPQPPLPGSAPGPAAEAPPLPQQLALALAGTRVLPAARERARAGPPLLRLRPHRVPRGARPLAGQVPHQVAEQDPLPTQRQRWAAGTLASESYGHGLNWWLSWRKPFFLRGCYCSLTGAAK
jgi:hypothetical protein